MENKIDVNQVPSVTWTWLKMNKDSVTLDAKFTSKPCSFEKLPEGIKLAAKSEVAEFTSGSGIANVSFPKKQDNNFDKLINKENENIKKQEEHPLIKLFAQNDEEPQVFVVEKSAQPVVLKIDGNNSPLLSHQVIHAKKDTESTFIFLYTGNANQFVRTEVFAEENASVHIAKVQMLEDQANQLDDTAFICKDNAKVTFTQIELGGQHVDSGLHTSLEGYKSTFVSNVAYICQNEQNLNMNHIVNHWGKKTECVMKVNGTVKNNAIKSYCGTIDFKKGCSGSKGNEMEETLLLSPTAINKSLPVILCDEEDVEGEHGSTIGRISQDILFYMQTRGITKEEAEALITRAKVQAVSDLIPSDDVKDKITNWLDK